MPVSVVSRVALVAALFLLSVTSSFSVSDRSIENFNNDSNMTAFTSTGGDNIEPLDSGMCAKSSVYSTDSLCVASSLQVPTESVLLEAINGAKTSIKALVYKFSSVRIYDALVEAQGRGVKIEIVGDHTENHGKESYLHMLSKLPGVHGYLYEHSGDRKVHAKLTIIDDIDVLTGSFNWSPSGMEENLELAILLRNSEENAKLFCKTFELVKDKAQSQG